MLSYRAASAASRRRKLLRSLLKTPPSEEKASNKWVTLEADAESNSKHQKASKHMSWIALILFIFYLGLVYLLSWLERGPDSYFQRPIDPLYFWATTVTTVGFGDILLTRQLTRALAIRESSQGARHPEFASTACRLSRLPASAFFGVSARHTSAPGSLSHTLNNKEHWVAWTTPLLFRLARRKHRQALGSSCRLE